MEVFRRKHLVHFELGCGGVFNITVGAKPSLPAAFVMVSREGGKFRLKPT